ncbi:MAG TPA: hypothetical protein DEV81_22875 [Cyanobacteria bacterium UBA11049]|nr:hypothetical protein [Cyanobacteria bacterium UBA11049]
MRKQDFDSHVASKEINRRGNSVKYILVAVVSVLFTLGFFAGGFLLYQMLAKKPAIAPVNNQTNGNNSTSVSSSTSSNSSTPGENSISSGQLVQPALGNKARVELTAVKRIPGKTDEVSVEMRIERLADIVDDSDVISVGSTSATNSDSSETYQAIDFLTRSSGEVTLSQMRRGQPVEAYVVLNVPVGVNTLDIYIDNTRPFKNVAIADAQAASGDNNSPVASSSSVIQPGQFVQNALGTKAQVELLSVKRLEDPKVASRDVVNVQMRIHRITVENPSFNDTISVGSTTARNPDTSETYKPVGSIEGSSSSISLARILPSSSVDAYVWLKVPKEVNNLDIYIPETAAFKNVPIAN